MSFDIVDYGLIEVEPVTLEEAKSYMQIDADYASDDNQIRIAISSARERLERYLNIGLVNRDIAIEWNGDCLKLPLTPNFEVVSVSDKDGVLTSDKYTVSQGRNKRISINGIASGNLNYFYSITTETVQISTEYGVDYDSVYTVIYNTGYEDLTNMVGLKQSLLAEANYLFKLRGNPVTDAISPNAALLSASYSKNLLL